MALPRKKKSGEYAKREKQQQLEGKEKRTSREKTPASRGTASNMGERKGENGGEGITAT